MIEILLDSAAASFREIQFRIWILISLGKGNLGKGKKYKVIAISEMNKKSREIEI